MLVEIEESSIDNRKGALTYSSRHYVGLLLGESRRKIKTKPAPGNSQGTTLLLVEAYNAGQPCNEVATLILSW